MSGDSSVPVSSRFAAVAQREGLLAHDLADNLTRESEDRGIPPAQLALQQGLLSAAQIEIVETLLNPQQIISGYEILGLLGYGGMGVVYRARQLSLGRIVALKTVMLGTNASPNRLSRFEQEARTVGKLLHPHIITAYDFGQDRGRFYFAMELVDGEDVECRIGRQGPFSEALTWNLVRQAAAGLAQAGEFGVVHRDIKPANLLLVTPPTGFPLPPGTPMVKIADFGLAFIKDDVDDRTRLTADNSTVGSPHYMAPEQLERSDIDLRADIYALGATAYHMLAGKPPFHGLTMPQIFAQKLNGSPAPLASWRSELTAETNRLIDDLMARDPSQRIANYVQLLNRIDQLLPSSPHKPGSMAVTPLAVSTVTRRIAGTQTTDDGIAKSPSSTPSIKNRRTLIGLVGSILIAAMAIAGIGYGVSLRRQEPVEPTVQPAAKLKPSGYAAELFDGESMAKWQTLAGNWQTATDDEGATVLAASHGSIMRKLQRDVPGQPPQWMSHYRLRFNTALRQAAAIELSFGIHRPHQDLEAWSVLRMEKDKASLRKQSTQETSTTPMIASAPLALDPNRYHEVRIERQAAEWRAYVDDHPIGAIPLAQSELPYFRLAVISPSDDRFAYFADFVVEELVAPGEPEP